MKRVILLSLLAICNFVAPSFAAKKIDVMLLTGHTDKHHNWEIMSQRVKDVVASYDVMRCDEVLFTDKESFAPKFSKYDVVVVNLNDVEWRDDTKRDFERYVERGGGVVILHEADNAFPEWEEYNKMIALGGWGGRTKSAGPYYYWQDGEYVRDTVSDFRTGHHGRRVPIDINVRETNHPIMKGLPKRWRHVDDELYSYMRGPAENIEVLATAFSDSKSGGSGREEPVLFTVTYGKGRIFHTVLGHTAVGFTAATENPGFQVIMLRGIEWAATGEVNCDRSWEW